MPDLQIDIDAGSLAADQVEHFTFLANRAIYKIIEVGDLSFPDDAELSVLLTNDEQIQGLNLHWREIDKPTNVLSFPGSDLNAGDTAGKVLGDIVISMETLAREADLEKKTQDDHFCHLIIHGFLHLFGYDHETDDEAEAMEHLERVALSKLGLADPYESESLQ